MADRIWNDSLNDDDQSTSVTSDRSTTTYRCYSQGRTRTARCSRGRPWDNAYIHNAGTRCRGKNGCALRSAIVPRRSCVRARHPSAVVSRTNARLKRFNWHHEIRGGSRGETKRYLVVEAAMAIEVAKVRQIGLAAPKLHIGNLQVVINYSCTTPRLVFVQIRRGGDVQMQRL